MYQNPAQNTTENRGTDAPQSPATDEITVLRCAPALVMAKTIRADGSVKVYDRAKMYEAETLPVGSLLDLYPLLVNIAADPRKCVVRGALINGPVANGIRRLVHADRETGDAPTLREQPRRWVALDIDKLPLDPSTPAADLEACAAAAIRQMPREFRMADCVVQATASHGRAGKSHLRLWYWLSRPVGGAELETWLKDQPVDPATLRTAQVCYTAAPVFDGAPDPIPNRVAHVYGLGSMIDEKGGETVAVPEQLPVEPRKMRSPAGLAADEADVAAAAAVIPNDGPANWDEWCRIGMAIFATTSGSEEGHEIFRAWSAQNDAHDDDACEERWKHWHRSRPTKIGAGSLFYEAQKAVPNWRKPSLGPNDGSEFEAVAAELPPEDPDAWKIKLSRSTPTKANEDGAISGTPGNCLIAFRHAPAWRGVLAYDEFKSESVYLKPPPYSQAEAAGPTDPDRHDMLLIAWLNAAGIPIRSERQAWKCLETVAGEASHRFHPVRAYLRSLKWDGVSRIDTLLIDHLGAEDDAAGLHRAFGARTLIGAVKRVMEPGCQLRTVLCLEGTQDIGKSKFVKKLVPDEAWWTDTCPNLDNKDSFIALRGIWIQEQGELATLGKAEANKAKAFLSSEKDTYRAPYDRGTKAHKRQCIFIATTNPAANGYLRDETGATRWWPVACGVTWEGGRTLDESKLESERDQLWAEAFVRYQAGEKYWLHEPHLRAAHDAATGDRFVDGAWGERIREFIAGRAYVTTESILTDCIKKPVADHTEAHTQTVGRTLKAAGWTRVKVRVRGKRRWTYVPTDTEEAKRQASEAMEADITKAEREAGKTLAAVVSA